MSVLLASVLGWVSGMRSATAPATLSAALAATPRRSDRFPASLLAVRPMTGVLATAAAGEMAADKQSWMPDRTDPPAIFGRVASGALVGAAVAGRRGTNRVLAALAGGAAAGVSSYVMRDVRVQAAEQLGAMPAALAEDALAVAVGGLASRAAAG